MKSLVDFTNEQLEIMSKESSPRGKNARYEIERRKSQHPLDKSSKQLDTGAKEPSDGAEDVLQTTGDNAPPSEENNTESSTEAPKRSRKTTRKRKEA